MAAIGFAVISMHYLILTQMVYWLGMTVMITTALTLTTGFLIQIVMAFNPKMTVMTMILPPMLYLLMEIVMEF